MYDTQADANEEPVGAETSAGAATSPCADLARTQSSAGATRQWVRGATMTTEPDEGGAIEIVAMQSDQSDEEDELGLAVRSQMRDNMTVGQTLVTFGLMDAGELTKLALAQRPEGDVVESLLAPARFAVGWAISCCAPGSITSTQLERALEIQRARGGMLGEILVERGWLVAESLQEALAAQERGRS